MQKCRFSVALKIHFIQPYSFKRDKMSRNRGLRTLKASKKSMWNDCESTFPFLAKLWLAGRLGFVKKPFIQQTSFFQNKLSFQTLFSCSMIPLEN